MTNLAQQTLNKARHKLAGQPRRTPAPIQQAGQPAQQIVSLQVVVDGPINHFMFLEGRRHAIDLAKSLSALSVADVIAGLSRSAAGHPASYALGIKSIADVIEAADIEPLAVSEVEL